MLKMRLGDPADAFTFKCQGCKAPVLAGPRFRVGGRTATLCWVCARLFHSAEAEAASLADDATREP